MLERIAILMTYIVNGDNMTKTECLTCRFLDLEDAGDHYVADIAATCKKQDEMPVLPNPHGNKIYLYEDNLILQSVVEDKKCPKYKIR